MGTISDKLMRIINTKEDIRQALISKGYDVPTSIPFKEYAKMISDLPCRVDSFPDIEGIVARYSALGLTNEQMAANPVWVDKTGNGHDLQMKNFLWDGMSGVGGYETNAEIYEFSPTSTNKIVADRVKHISFTFEVKGMVSGNDLSLRDGLNTIYYSWKKDGIYTVDIDVLDPAGTLRLYNGYSHQKGTFTVRIFPSYPGALVFDGVDDYGVCDNFPILTKEKGYTVVALRQIISTRVSSVVSKLNASDDGAFLFEGYNLAGDYISGPFGTFVTDIEKSPFSYMTSVSYNGTSINPGNKLDKSNMLAVGTFYNDVFNHYFGNIALWELIIFDHDATEEELTKIKDYFIKTYPWLFPDQAWTVTGKTNEDEDRATIANITGNGNDLVLSNFGFAEGSGYGLYGQNYISYATTNRAVYTKNNSSIHVTKSITAGVNFTESARDVTIPSYRIKVTGIQSGQEMIYRGRNNTFLTNIPSDGTYVLPAVENGSNLGFQFVSYTGDCDITIEQIPEYEGYLVTDGVDDKIDSSAFKMGEDFTVVGEWKLLPVSSLSYSGMLKNDNLYLYNNASTGLRVYIRSTDARNDMEGLKSLKAICSDGRVYGEDWTEYKLSIGSTIGSQSRLYLGYNNTAYTKMIFKNLGIYNNQILSKEDCIKAYNYLQTLKSK